MEDLVLFASLTTSSEARVSQRFQRHFAVIHVPNLEGHNLSEVVSQQFHSLIQNHMRKFDGEMCKQLLEATTEVYSSVKHALNNSDMPGRQHYFFSLSHLESVFQVSLNNSLHVSHSNYCIQKSRCVTVWYVLLYAGSMSL